MEERLIQIMSDNSLTYTKMADMIGYSPNTVYYWTKGRNKPTIDAVMTICKTFNVSADWLLFGKRDGYMFEAVCSYDGKTVVGFLMDIRGDYCFIKPVDSGEGYRCDLDTLKRYIDGDKLC